MTPSACEPADPGALAATTIAGLEQRLALVLDTIGAGDWEWDLDSGRLRCSDRAAALLGLPNAGGHPIAVVFAALDDVDLETLHSALAELLAGRSDRLQVDCPCRGIDAPRWLRLSGRVVARSAAGEPRTVMGLVLDITDERRRDVQLASVQKLDAIGRLAAGVAHEINTPLQFVSHNLDFLASEVALIAGGNALDPRGPAPGESLDEPAANHARDIAWWRDVQSAIAESIDGLDRVTTIVRALKQFAHRGTGPRTVVDVNAVIESAVTLTRPEWKVAAALDLALTPGLPLIDAAAVECGQVFVNLLVNAAHAVHAANPAGTRGTIAVASRMVGSQVEVRVTDSGVGIPPEVQHRVFEPFFTTKAVGHGTGQGLATARAIVERHGGSITFETAVGRGTTFVVGFPVASGVERAA